MKNLVPLLALFFGFWGCKERTGSEGTLASRSSVTRAYECAIKSLTVHSSRLRLKDGDVVDVSLKVYANSNEQNQEISSIAVRGGTSYSGYATETLPHEFEIDAVRTRDTVVFKLIDPREGATKFDASLYVHFESQRDRANTSEPLKVADLDCETSKVISP